jgi:hypothetical protein
MGGAFLMPALAPAVAAKFGAGSAGAKALTGMAGWSAGTKFMVGSMAGNMASSFLGGDEGYAASIQMTNNAMSMVQTVDAIDKMVTSNRNANNLNRNGDLAGQTPREAASLTRTAPTPVTGGNWTPSATLGELPAPRETPPGFDVSPGSFPSPKTTPQYTEEDWFRLRLPGDILTPASASLQTGEHYD